MNISLTERKKMYDRYLAYCDKMEEPDTDFLFEDDTNNLLREMTCEEFYESLNYSRRNLYITMFGSDIQ